MPCLYVTEPGATVRLTGESLLVTANEHGSDGTGRRKTLMEVESHRLELVVLVGRAHITSGATLFCLDRGISLAWLSRGGELRGRMIPPLMRSADVRLGQYHAFASTEERLARARTVVDAKVANAFEVLRDIQSNEAGNEKLSSAIVDLKTLREDIASCPDIARLLGLEGSGARAYFKALGGAFKAEIGFAARRHRPAPDPANALLSFGYVILGNRVSGALEARGLDPCLGFFHELRPGRPSLALDLLEEFRHPVVDRFVLRACNLRIFRPEMFEPPDEDGGVRLTRDGLKTFFAHWEEHLQRPMRERNAEKRLPPLELVRRQVDRLAASLRRQEEYVPFHYGG